MRRSLAALTTAVVVAVLGAALAVPALPAGAQTATTSGPAAVATSASDVGSTSLPAKAGDTQSSRTVNRIVLALLALAGLLLVLVVWLWRMTKPAPAHLDGLDAMGSRRWRRASQEERAAMLAPVHERRSELRDEDLIAPAEADDVPAAADHAVVGEDALPVPADADVDAAEAPADDEAAPPEPHVTSSEAVT